MAQVRLAHTASWRVVLRSVVVVLLLLGRCGVTLLLLLVQPAVCGQA